MLFVGCFPDGVKKLFGYLGIQSQAAVSVNICVISSIYWLTFAAVSLSLLSANTSSCWDDPPMFLLSRMIGTWRGGGAVTSDLFLFLRSASPALFRLRHLWQEL
jgi:hypothetical protein